MSNIQELHRAVKELQSLQEQATVPKVRDILSLDIRKLQTEIIQKEEKLKKERPQREERVHVQSERPQKEESLESERPQKEKTLESDGAQEQEEVKEERADSPVETGAATDSKPVASYTKEITTYGWDQSDKFMKIYVTLNGVQNLDKDNVKSEFTENSFRLRVDNLNGENFAVHIANLYEDILLQGSYHKIKTDMVLVMLKKAKPSTTWAYVTKKEKKASPKKPKVDENKDPQEGLMDMLKQMYDEGDDEMKRTISKAWTESRMKQSTTL